MRIELNLEAAAVLLRCLGYGEAAVSQGEVESGEAAVIYDNIKLIRDHVCRGIAGKVIAATASDERQRVAETIQPVG